MSILPGMGIAQAVTVAAGAAVPSATTARAAAPAPVPVSVPAPPRAQPLASPGAPAQQAPVAVEKELIAEVRERTGTAQGRESYRFVPATVLSQGEVVYYTVRIRNPAPVPAKNVIVVQRVPANTSYIAGSASGPGAHVTFSVDGGQSFAAPERLYVNVQGKRERADAAHYTHIRWALRNPLAPGAVALARFRAVFD